MKTGVIASVEKMLLLLLLESSLLLLTLLLSLSSLISLVRKSTDDCNHSCQRKWFLKLDLVYCDVVLCSVLIKLPFRSFDNRTLFRISICLGSRLAT